MVVPKEPFQLEGQEEEEEEEQFYGICSLLYLGHGPIITLIRLSNMIYGQNNSRFHQIERQTRVGDATTKCEERRAADGVR